MRDLLLLTLGAAVAYALLRRDWIAELKGIPAEAEGAITEFAPAIGGAFDQGVASLTAFVDGTAGAAGGGFSLSTNGAGATAGCRSCP